MQTEQFEYQISRFLSICKKIIHIIINKVTASTGIPSGHKLDSPLADRLFRPVKISFQTVKKIFSFLQNKGETIRTTHAIA